MTLAIPDSDGSTLTLNDLGGRATIVGTVSPANGSLLANFDLDGGHDTALSVANDLGIGTVRVRDVDIIGGTTGFFAESGGAGAIDFDTASSISGVDDTAVRIEAPNFEATFNNTIDHTGSGPAVAITGHQNGTIEFNNTITAAPTGGDGIFITITAQCASHYCLCWR